MNNRKGVALLSAIVIAMMLVVLATALTQLLSSYYITHARTISRMKAYYAAQAGIAEAFRRGNFNAAPFPAGGNFTIAIPWRYDLNGNNVVESATVRVTVMRDPATGTYIVRSTSPIR